jgi:carbon storage regulator
MLVLTRRINETIIIADDIRVTVLEICGDRVRFGATAPDPVIIDRAEVHARRSPRTQRSATTEAANN